MNVSCIINIDNSSKSEYKVKKSQYKNNIYKKINCSKSSLIKNRNDVLDLSDWLRNQISKGHSIYINIENYIENKYDWIFVVIVILTYIVKVNHIEIANYLKEKINFIKNISQIIDLVLNSNGFDEIFEN